MFQACNVLFKPRTPNVKGMYGSACLLGLAGPPPASMRVVPKGWAETGAALPAGAARELGGTSAFNPPVLLPPLMMPRTIALKPPLLGVGFSHPRDAFKGTGDNWHPTKTGFKLGRGHPTPCGLLELFCPMRAWSIANWGWRSLVQLCSTLSPEHFNSAHPWFLLLPLQARTLTPGIHTRPLSYLLTYLLTYTVH